MYIYIYIYIDGFDSVGGRNPAPPGNSRNPFNNGINHLLLVFFMRAGILLSTGGNGRDND